MRTLSELFYGVSPQNRSYLITARIVITVTGRQSNIWGQGHSQEMIDYVIVSEDRNPWHDNGMENPLRIIKGKPMRSNQYVVELDLPHLLTKGQLHAFERHIFMLAKSVMEMGLAGVLSVEAAVSTETAARYTA